MPNVTISLDEKLLKAGREYARQHQTSMNALIRRLLKQTVEARSSQKMDECFELMDSAGMNSQGRQWKREDLYDV